MNEWKWHVENGEVFIVSNGKKIAKMLEDDFNKDEMINNTTTITVSVNDYHRKLKEVNLL